MEKKLKEVHEKNKQESQYLLEKAQTISSHLTQPCRPKEVESPETEVPTVIKAKPSPTFKVLWLITFFF